ncbi:MAG: MBL fold metallo-hydrolase [Amoebophilaceae bacterium]|jgi:glyoxylase-like metal-dependent hydrolase (beta-lactamase superfamily II)|nr:MBL fold metallo-hydrolase [Amoebophilaceae bacterium]
MLYVQCFTFNAFAENTYVVYDETNTCVVVDPGCYELHEQEELSNFIQTRALKVAHLVNTHAHIDHILGNQYVRATYGVPLALHHQEVPILRAAIEYAPIYGFTAYRPTEAERLLTAGDVIQLGNTQLSILHVPGHSPGHIALYSQRDALCLSGDVLFRGAIGRTDLPGGDRMLLLQSLHQQLFSLENKVFIYPGHGPSTTIGVEKKDNFQANAAST